MQVSAVSARMGAPMARPQRRRLGPILGQLGAPMRDAPGGRPLRALLDRKVYEMTHTKTARQVLKQLNYTDRFAPEAHLCILLYRIDTKEAETLRDAIRERLYPAGTVNAYLWLKHGVSQEDRTVHEEVQRYRMLWLLELARELDAL